jgi:uncharacterized protein with PhoU and TrkA domain
MIDLAYSSFLYNNKEIAEDVLELEDYMDELHSRLEFTVLAEDTKGDDKKVRGQLGLLKMATAGENIADAATQIALLVKKGIPPHPVFRMVMDEAEEIVLRTNIAPESILTQKSIGDLGLEDNIGMWIIAVRHGKDWYYNPSEEFVLSPKDIIITRGYATGRDSLEKLASGELDKI